MTIRYKMVTIVAGLVLFIFAFWIWMQLVKPTRIALVNYPTFMSTSIGSAVSSPFIDITALSLDDFDTLDQYDVSIIFGMGLDLTDSQREWLQHMAEHGRPVHVTSSPNPQNRISGLDSTSAVMLEHYLQYGGAENYRNMMSFIRNELDGKRLFTPGYMDPFRYETNVFFHTGEDHFFESMEEYLSFYNQAGLYREGSASIAIVPGLLDPFNQNREPLDHLILALEKEGYNVFPVTGSEKRFEFLTQIEPDAVIYFPHGRLLSNGADQAVEWLKERNIPLIAPLVTIQPYEDWLDDRYGMGAGFVSQSVAVPEFDGSIAPWVFFAPMEDDNGLYPYRTIPERLEDFVERVSGYVSLQQTPNEEKRVAIYYYKGPGNSGLTAASLEVVPSLYELLKTLREEGYRVEGLPDCLAEFEKRLMREGPVLGPYAKGEMERWMQDAAPAFVDVSRYEEWAGKALPEALYRQVTQQYGPAPGRYMSSTQNGDDAIAVARVAFGNVVLLPQPMPAEGDDEFAIIHGVDEPPAHPYIASYLWSRYGFEADAIIHFGTHGSLEFTPGKAVALGSYDWPDRLIGSAPHLYYYTIGNVGEAMMAKRRVYATTVSHLTQPFMESKTSETFQPLYDEIANYHRAEEHEKKDIALRIKERSHKQGLLRSLRMDTTSTVPLTESEITRIENFAIEIANANIVGSHYVLGRPFGEEQLRSSVLAMTRNAVAYSRMKWDALQDEAHLQDEARIQDEERIQLSSRAFSEQYLEPAVALIQTILDRPDRVTDHFVAEYIGIDTAELAKAEAFAQKPPPPVGGPGSGGPPHWVANGVQHGSSSEPDIPEKMRKRWLVINEISSGIKSITEYADLLRESPQKEKKAILNALNGGYTPPTPGGDIIANPNTLPTGRNLVSVNPESTPTHAAWDKGVELSRQLLDDYLEKHGQYPKRINMTLWSGAFIETGGAPFAQVLYLLGVEPIRDPRGVVRDLRVIPLEELGRPRVDVVIQTSGQLRDIAASRLALVNRAIAMVSGLREEGEQNQVARATANMEKALVQKGYSPRDARTLSTYRIFGGVNGRYGTGIIGMVEASDRWESEGDVAQTYITNMGAIYDNEEEWGAFHKGLMEAALEDTDVVLHSRQSNTWGPLGLDHVYEFMGGINLAVRHVTGKEPEAYFSDYRNRYRPRAQELKEAIGVEAQTTLLNPAFIEEQMNGAATTAGTFAETFRNIFGWSVMRQEVIDQEFWDDLYDVYMEDAFQLQIEDYFASVNPAAFQEMTAVMLESARKEYWQADESQIRRLAELHADFTDRYGPSCSNLSCNNRMLKALIEANLDPEQRFDYNKAIEHVRQVSQDRSDDEIVMEREEIRSSSWDDVRAIDRTYSGLLAIAGIVLFVLAALWLRKRKNAMEEP